MKKVKLFEQFINESINIKYWADYHEKSTKITSASKVNRAVEDEVEEWNLNNEDGKDNEVTNGDEKKVIKLAHDFFRAAGWISTDIIQAMISQEAIGEAIVNEEVNFPAQFEIGEPVSFITAPGDDERWGSVVKVSFTKAKVFYDILDDYTSNVIGNIDSCFVKTLKSNITLGESLNEAKDASREEIMDMMETKYKIKHVRTSEEFMRGDVDGIWIAGDNGEELSGNKIFDYYNKSAKYKNGVLKNVVDAVEKKGWWFSWNDPGTMMIWPKN
jgi:hypothetical protein